MIEIFLGAFLALMLILSAVAVHKSKKRAIANNICAEKQWRWLLGAEEIEWKLRRWEIEAAQCLRNGFSPFEISDQEMSLWQLDSARPMLVNMGNPRYMTVAAPHLFSQQQQVLLCTPYQRVLQGQIQMFLAGFNSQEVVLIVEYPNAETTPLLPAGTAVAAANKIAYTREDMHSEGRGAVYENSPMKGKVVLARLLDDFQATSEETPQGQALNLHFSTDDGCELKSQIVVHHQAAEPWFGRWYIKDNGVDYQPWVTKSGDNS